MVGRVILEWGGGSVISKRDVNNTCGPIYHTFWLVVWCIEIVHMFVRTCAFQICAEQSHRIFPLSLDNVNIDE